MTRVLSELLGAREPAFHQGLQRLERASGHTSADIRLTSELERATRSKIKELGLDPDDTTGEELYHALQQRVRADDARLSARLQHRYGDEPIHVQVGKALSELPIYKSCFALKTATVKRLLQKVPPKQTIHALGYRSFDSLLRREQLLNIYATAWMMESTTWRKTMLDAYKKLSPADFEIRPLAILTPHSPHWQKLAEQIVMQKKHNIAALPECGAVVILPLPNNRPPAAAMTTLLIALHSINEVRASSTFLKLSQMHTRFGACVQAVVSGEPLLPASLLDGSVSWHVIQRYYARYGDRFREDLFEPHVQKEDLSWHSIEKALNFIEPSITFWHNTSTLGLHDRSKPVSLNVIDAALNFCNQLPFKDRLVGYFRKNLLSELAIRYLKHDNVEQAVMSSLEPQLSAATAPSEEEFDAVQDAA